jgi:hypothetical protein
MQGGAIWFDCVFGARLLEISGSSFVANGDGGVDEVGGGVDASSGTQPVICVGAECSNGNFTCAEYLSYAVAVKKQTIQGTCMGLTLEYIRVYEDTTFFNLPEGVTAEHYADGFLIADMCPAECSEVISRVSRLCFTTTQCGNYA